MIKTITEMKITLVRIAKKSTYTIGKLYVDGVYCCDTLEDVDRMLDDKMSESEIKRKKVMHQTAIPTGTYKIDMDTFSSRFGNVTFYRNTCGGRLPRLLKVKGFDGILLHCGNTPSDTSGCVLVGYNKVVGKVINSQDAFKTLYNKMWNRKDIYIEIQRKYK